jgi:hypothetical protein
MMDMAFPAEPFAWYRYQGFPAVPPDSSILCVDRRIFVGPVCRLCEEPMLPSDRFHERKVERRRRSDDSESAFDYWLDRGRSHRSRRGRWSEGQEERLRDRETGPGECLFDDGDIRAEALLERRLESKTATDTAQGRGWESFPQFRLRQHASVEKLHARRTVGQFETAERIPAASSVLRTTDGCRELWTRRDEMVGFPSNPERCADRSRWCSG